MAGKRKTDAPPFPQGAAPTEDEGARIRAALERLVKSLRATPPSIQGRLGLDVAVSLSHAERVLGIHPVSKRQ